MCDIVVYIEFALGYSKSTDYRARVLLTAVIGALAYGSRSSVLHYATVARKYDKELNLVVWRSSSLSQN